MKDKKAQFFIILLPLIAFVLFTLSLIMYQYSVSFEDRLSEFAAFDRMNNIDLSTQNAIRQIFNDKSNMAIQSPNDVSVSINEILPFSHGALNNSLDSFKTYLESNFDFIKLNINETKTTLPLYIKSHNLLYYHPVGIINNVNNITVSSISISNIEGYDIVMRINTNFNAQTCVTTSGTKRLTISVYASNGTIYQCGSSNTALSGSSGSLTLTDGTNIYINVGAQGNLEAIIPTTITTNITTTLFLLNNYNKPEVVLPSGIINIDYPSFGITKRGDVKII